MVMTIESIMKNGMQIGHVDNAYYSIDWILDYPENIENWKARMFELYKIERVILK